MAEKPPKRDSPSLDRLYRTRSTARKIQWRMSAREYLEGSFASAIRLSQAAGLRSDALVSMSCFPELLQEYREGKSDIFHRLLDQGVAAGFVFYPEKICHDNLALLMDIPDQIRAAAGSEVFITGYSIGSRHCTADFVAFDFLKVLSALQQVFARIPGGEEARFATFCPGAEPISLDAAKELAAYQAAMAQIQQKG